MKEITLEESKRTESTLKLSLWSSLEKSLETPELLELLQKILENSLEEDLKPLINKDIFEHGYPETRLIPSNFEEECIDCFTDEIKEKVLKSGLKNVLMVIFDCIISDTIDDVVYDIIHDCL